MLGHNRILAAAAAAFMGSALLSGAFVIGTSEVYAASGSERECTSGGGEYVKNGSDSVCEYPATTKDVNGNAYGTETQETTTGHGNLDNKPVDTCTGNPGQCKQQ